MDAERVIVAWVYMRVCACHTNWLSIKEFVTS